jgi:hypothetical protein
MAVMNFSIEDLELVIAKAKENGFTRVNMDPCGEYEQGIRTHANVHFFGTPREDSAGGLFLKAVKPNLLQDQGEKFYKQPPIFILKPGSKDTWKNKE